jgi:hypothetical protein
VNLRPIGEPELRALACLRFATWANGKTNDQRGPEQQARQRHATYERW